jgi:lipoprotein signal peptidase
VLGFVAIVLSILHLSTSAGAVFGSGSGKAGALFGLVLGLIAITMGWLALRKKTEQQ